MPRRWRRRAAISRSSVSSLSLSDSAPAIAQCRNETLSHALRAQRAQQGSRASFGLFFLARKRRERTALDAASVQRQESDSREFVFDTRISKVSFFPLSDLVTMKSGAKEPRPATRFELSRSSLNRHQSTPTHDQNSTRKWGMDSASACERRRVFSCSR